MFRPTWTTHSRHIDPLFTDAIHGELIHAHLPAMVRVVLSVQTGQAGRLTASPFLRRLGSYSRNNRF